MKPWTLRPQENFPALGAPDECCGRLYRSVSVLFVVPLVLVSLGISGAWLGESDCTGALSTLVCELSRSAAIGFCRVATSTARRARCEGRPDLRRPRAFLPPPTSVAVDRPSRPSCRCYSFPTTSIGFV